ncbi:alpha-L-rhamnosidase C-terminal domain-containing protein [Dyadobacter psychrotolerans]|uniref:Alpha-L-rhamnosidase C-terminal domain-containing protein n=1 Tax=Dyadobacter psychrotolerans TaxID=2541721 RepID=A0A4R5DH73_9BACT|nr:alpha-L-rhamnosidase C-terminal domain-containing protein [Dyadobacter psychrotolerans]TDE11271.1 hypothetical protein E0F88_25495 [Dyadobacter psychrotolerans]
MLRLIRSSGSNLTATPYLSFTCWFILCYSVTGCRTDQTGNSVKPTAFHTDLEETAIQEPYKYLNQGSFSENKISDSPDPLINYKWSRLDSNLQIYNLHPVDIITSDKESFKNVKSGPTSFSNIEVTGTGSLRFDFGTVSAAWLEFDSPDFNGEVRLSISEYNQPAILNEGPAFPEKTAKPVKYGETYRLELNKELYEGVRFGWIHVDKIDKPWHITNIRLVCQIKPVNYEGSFACSDHELTRIWYTGAYTVKLNLLKNYFGAILMDRGDRISWTGDAHTSQAAALVAFGNYEMIRENIRRTSADFNGIASYSLYWILSLVDYVNYTGDKKLLAEMREPVIKKMQHGEKLYGTKVKLGFYGWDERLGAGFENPDNPENQLAYRMLFIQACKALSQVYQAIGIQDDAVGYEKLADKKLSELRLDKNWTKTLGLHAAADAVGTGLLNDTEKKILLNLYKNPADNVSFSPFNQYFIIKSMSQLGLYDEALTSINDSWGGQLRMGATTFWECFRPQWSEVINPLDPVPNGQCGYTSLCHPWSSGVTKWLSEEVLGIKPLAPGFADFMIKPNLSKGLTWVNGSVQTPHGKITCGYDREKGTAELVVPKGTTGSFAIPKSSGILKLIVNNKTVLEAGMKPDTLESVTEDAGFVYLNNIKPGFYSFEIKYKKERSAEKVKEISAPLLSGIKENQTSGQKKFGKDGSIFFNQNGVNKHLVNLPVYIDSLTWKHSGPGAPGLLFMGDKPENKSADNQNIPFVLGALTTRNPSACTQTIYLDIFSRKPGGYTFSVFVKDLEKKQTRFIVELFDLQSKNIVSVPSLIEETQNGKYITFTCAKPVRVRISHIRGGNALVSGVFFQ